MFVHSSARISRVRRGIAIAGGAWAIFLIGVQVFAIGAWCKLCLVADPAAIVYAIGVLVARTPRDEPPVRFTWARAAAMVPALAMVAGVLALWTSTPAPRAPLAAPAELAHAGELTVVEYVDFECPHCRVMQQRLDAAIATSSRPVKVVRKMVPIEQHRGALIAALAWCIADAHGKGDAMARALFTADPRQLTQPGCEALAAKLGIDLATFRAGLPAAHERVKADVAEASRIGIAALPTLFVGHERFVGAGASTRELLAALERAGA
jgi:predicted DsbA family dithiol-disulfide isomerase